MENTSQLLTGNVKDLSGEGWGIVSHDNGNTYFVRGAWPGDEVSFEVISQEGKFGEARIKEILKPSPDRRATVPCQYQGFDLGKCGGCSWMMATYQAQLQAKERRLAYLLKRFKIILPPEGLKKIIASPEEFAFRNRAQFKSDGTQLGFVSPESNHIVDVKECKVLNPRMSDNLKTLRSKLPNSEWQAPDKFKWNFIDCDDDQVDDFPANLRRPFKQGNAFQNQAMKNWLKTHVDSLDSNRGFTEFYAGGGNFTEILAEKGFENIFAVENAPDSLEKLRAKKLKNVKVFNGDLSQRNIYRDLGINFGKQTGYLLMDPPREGALGIEDFTRKAPKIDKIFYISCEVKTWIRDVSLLQRYYRVVEVQPLDQFPHTPHLEILSVLERVVKGRHEN